MKEPDWINQNYKNKMHIIQVIIEYLKMLISREDSFMQSVMKEFCWSSLRLH